LLPAAVTIKASVNLVVFLHSLGFIFFFNQALFALFTLFGFF
jgi:hypothetical protein